MLRVVFAALETEHFVEDRLDYLLPRIRFAADSLALQAFERSAKLARVKQHSPGIGEATGNRLYILRAKQRVKNRV